LTPDASEAVDADASGHMRIFSFATMVPHMRITVCAHVDTKHVSRETFQKYQGYCYPSAYYQSII